MHARDIKFFNALADTLDSICKSNPDYLVKVASGHQKDLAIVLFPYKASHSHDLPLNSAYFESPFIIEFITAIHAVYAIPPSKRFGELALLHDKFCNIIEREVEKSAAWSNIQQLFDGFGKQNYLMVAITKAISSKICLSFQVDRSEFDELSALFKTDYDLSREGKFPLFKEGFNHGLSQSLKLALSSSVSNIPLVKSSTTDQLSPPKKETTPRSMPSSPNGTPRARPRSGNFTLLFMNISQVAKASKEEGDTPKEEPTSARSLLGRVFGRKGS